MSGLENTLTFLQPANNGIVNPKEQEATKCDDEEANSRCDNTGLNKRGANFLKINFCDQTYIEQGNWLVRCQDRLTTVIKAHHDSRFS